MPAMVGSTEDDHVMCDQPTPPCGGIRLRRLASVFVCTLLAVPSPAALAQMATGAYMGNGTSQSITNVGIQPDVVIVKGSYGSNRMTYIRTSTMTGDVSKKLNDDSQGLFANMIQSLDANGFTVGNDVAVNSDGSSYYWIAFNAVAGELKVDSYLGNGTNNTSIGGVGFQPDYLIVFGENASKAYHKSSSMPATRAARFGAWGLFNNVIKAFEANGFKVTASTAVNADGVTYHYVAWKAVAGRMAVGQYPGNGGANQSIASVGFQPKYVIVKADDTITPVHRPESLAGDWTLHFEALANASDGIQALNATGFEVGSDDTVNKSSTEYYWMAFSGPSLATNYRSIGTRLTKLYSAGTASASAGSTTITFAGGTLPADVGQGDRLIIGAETFYIYSKDSAAQVTVQSPATRTTFSRRTRRPRSPSIRRQQAPTRPRRTPLRVPTTRCRRGRTTGTATWSPTIAVRQACATTTVPSMHGWTSTTPRPTPPTTCT